MIALRPVAWELLRIAATWKNGLLLAGLWTIVQGQPQVAFVAAEVEGRVRFFDQFGRSVRATLAHGTELTLSEAAEIAT